MRRSHGFRRGTPRWRWGVMIGTAAVVLPGAALVAKRASVAGTDEAAAAIAVQGDGKDEADPPEHPRLRFLASQHQPPEVEQEPLGGSYWLPTGERVEDQKRLFQLRRLGGWREDERVPGSAFLYVFISHPDFARYPVGTIDVVNADGSRIDETLLGIRWVRANGPLGQRVAARWRGPGWQFYQVRVRPEVALPGKGMIRLHYTTGRGESAGKFAVAKVQVGKPLIEGVILSEIVDADEGRSRLAITVAPGLGQRFQYQLEMHDLEGRRVRLDGYGAGRDGVYRFSFRKPLAALGEFELLHREKRSLEYRDVHLQPRMQVLELLNRAR